MNRTIHCILPVYNEGQSIYDLLNVYSSFFKELDINNKIIVVNDCSNDNSESFILKAKEEFHNLNIEYIKHEINKGLGGALSTGFQALSDEIDTHDLVVCMDGDNTHNPYLIKQMIDKANEGADISIASRYLEQSRIYGLSKFRIFLSLCAKFIYSITWNIEGVKDYTCGFRCYKASLVKQFIEKYQNSTMIEEKGFAATGEILRKLSQFDPLIVEVPMILRYSNKVNTSNMQIARTIYKTLGMIWKK